MNYTSNLNLKKPESTDFYDVSDFNDNTDNLDAVVGGLRNNLCPVYNSTSTYNRKDIVSYNNAMYICNADGTTGTWDSSKWTSIDLKSLLKNSDQFVGGYYYNSNFYEDSAHTSVIVPNVNKLYVDLTNQFNIYRYTGSTYQVVSDWNSVCEKLSNKVTNLDNSDIHYPSSKAVKTVTDSLSTDIADVKGYIGYTASDIYGVEVDFANKTFTRLAGAIGKSAGSDFNSIAPWSGRRRCNLSDSGVVNAYYGGSGYVETGANGQVMVEQPAFYYKVVPISLTKNSNGAGFHMRKARYYVSATPKEGFKLHPAFIQNGVEKQKIYLSAYEGSTYDVSANAYNTTDTQTVDWTNDKLASIANAKPTSGLSQGGATRAGFRTIAAKRGTGWSQQTVQSVSASQLLFLIEYGHFNTQSQISRGVVDKTDDGSTNMSNVTGATSSLGNSSGMASGTNGLVSVSYRGEENIWGNIWKWVDGINIYPYSVHHAYIADHGFADNKGTDPYKDAGFTLSFASGYVSAFGYSDEEYDWLFLPSECSGNDSLPVGDYFWQNATYASSWLVARLGASWDSGSEAGGFCWSVTTDSGSRSRAIGGRLLFVPQ